MLLSQGRLYPFPLIRACGGDSLGIFYFSWVRGHIITLTPYLGSAYVGLSRLWGRF
jgi:hypothetical protein